MANHKWDFPKSKLGAKCLKCGVMRFAVSKRFGRWEYRTLEYLTLIRPDCRK